MVRQSIAHAGSERLALIAFRDVRKRVLCASAIAVLSILSAEAPAESPQTVVEQHAAESHDDAVDTVTVEAQRERLQRQISEYVSSITINNRNDSLARWQLPICPLVAGLPFEQGKFVFLRVSQVASEAGIPLDSQDCRPNLLVVMTREPEKLLQEWWSEQPNLFSRDRGLGGIKRKIRTQAPVRVFHNACSVPSGLSKTFSPAVMAHCGTGTLGTKLTRGAIRAIYSVIVVVDLQRTKDLEIGPLTDYIAMVSLAQIREDSELGAAPTILRLFDETGAARPQGLSTWDQAFLESLYEADSRSVTQLSGIKLRMHRDLVH